MASAGVGGTSYLHTLIAREPTAANATYYPRYSAAAGAGRDVDDVIDLAQQAVYDVTERRVSEDYAVLADMHQPTLDETTAVGAPGGMMTGFTNLDRPLNGLHAGQLVVVARRPVSAKKRVHSDHGPRAQRHPAQTAPAPSSRSK